jgi:hypothetical protein
MNLSKILIPGVVGLVFALSVVGYWVSEIVQRSWRTDGTVLDKYSTTYPTIKNPVPSTVFWCDPAYKSPWAGCAFK